MTMARVLCCILTSRSSLADDPGGGEGVANEAVETPRIPVGVEVCGFASDDLVESILPVI